MNIDQTTNPKDITTNQKEMDLKVENEDSEDEEDEENEESDVGENQDLESDNQDGDLDEEEEDGEDLDEEDDDEFGSKKKNRKPSDVLEEKTVFIRNLDLDTTEKSLSELLRTFGPLEYCKICINRYTEKSRGTAFAKFKKKEDAQKCLKEDLIPDGQRISVTLAVTRNKLIEIENDKHNKHKDKRNLYLAKEGLIYPNSPAAVGLSQTDLKKRLQVWFDVNYISL